MLVQGMEQDTRGIFGNVNLNVTDHYPASHQDVMTDLAELSAGHKHW